MEKVFISGKMGRDMRETSKMESLVKMVLFTIVMEKDMKDDLKMEYNMEMVHFIL